MHWRYCSLAPIHWGYLPIFNSNNMPVDGQHPPPPPYLLSKQINLIHGLRIKYWSLSCLQFLPLQLQNFVTDGRAFFNPWIKLTNVDYNKLFPYFHLCTNQMSKICNWQSILPLVTYFNTLRSRPNGCHFADDIIKCIFVNVNVHILIKISLRFVPKGQINNIPALVQIMDWHRPGDKPLSEPMLVNLLAHIWVTRPRSSQSHAHSLKFVLKGSTDNMSETFQIMVWYQTGDKPLFELIMV